MVNRGGSFCFCEKRLSPGPRQRNQGPKPKKGGGYDTTPGLHAGDDGTWATTQRHTNTPLFVFLVRLPVQWLHTSRTSEKAHRGWKSVAETQPEAQEEEMCVQKTATTFEVQVCRISLPTLSTMIVSRWRCRRVDIHGRERLIPCYLCPYKGYRIGNSHAHLISEHPDRPRVCMT